MRLKDVKVERGEGRVRVAGEIERTGGGQMPAVWFEYGDEYADFVRADADVFIPILLSASMLAGEPLASEMPVSAKMARELPRVQAIRIFRRDTAGPSEHFSPSGVGGADRSFLSTQSSAFFSLRLGHGSLASNVREPERRMSPLLRYRARVYPS